MPKVLFATANAQNHAVREMEYLPGIGDTVPLFYDPPPKVITRCWFPNVIDGITVPTDIDVVIILR